MGQGGNVWEWEETDFDLVNDSSSSGRGVRGATGTATPQFVNSSSDRSNFFSSVRPDPREAQRWFSRRKYP